MGNVAGDENAWGRATWEGAREAVLLEGARMTLREKLAWLESAHRLALRIAGDPKPETDAPAPGADTHR